MAGGGKEGSGCGYNNANDYCDHHNSHTQTNADASIALLCGPSSHHGHDGKDEGWDGPEEGEEERNTAADQRDDGQHQRGHCHPSVVLLGRGLNGRDCLWLGAYHSGHSRGLSDRVVAGRLPAIVGKRLGLLRRKLGRSGLVYSFGKLLVLLVWEEGL